MQIVRCRKCGVLAAFDGEPRASCGACGYAVESDGGPGGEPRRWHEPFDLTQVVRARLDEKQRQAPAPAT